jgi:hypothetical protein
MKFEQYTATASTEHTEYHFTSTGPNGDFSIIIQYTYIEKANVFNLGFGLLQEDGNVDDTFRTNNGDMEKILATVGNTVLSFSGKHPDIPVFATGNDMVRTRLYRRMLTRNKDAIEKLFRIYGQKDNEWHKFEANIDYDSFLVIRRKDVKFDTDTKIFSDDEEE